MEYFESAIDDLDPEIRSRVLAAAGNASFGVAVTTGDGWVVYAITGDSFVRMRLALRADGSVAEDTDVLPLDEVMFASVDRQAGALILEGDKDVALVPASVIDAVRKAQGGWHVSDSPAQQGD